MYLKMNGSSTTKDKDCDCVHVKQEHGLFQKSMSTWNFLLSPDRLMTLEEGKRKCVKCHCSEYGPSKRFEPRWGMDYSLRKILHVDEKRCTRCGCLLQNHENMSHSFQFMNKTPA